MDIFDKTYLLPLSPPNMNTNTQVCVASIKASSIGINHIEKDTIAPIKLLKTSTNNPMLILQLNGSTQQLSRNILLRTALYFMV